VPGACVHESVEALLVELQKFFPNRLVVTYESGDLSKDADEVISRRFS